MTASLSSRVSIEVDSPLDVDGVQVDELISPHELDDDQMSCEVVIDQIFSVMPLKKKKISKISIPKNNQSPSSNTTRLSTTRTRCALLPYTVGSIFFTVVHIRSISFTMCCAVVRRAFIVRNDGRPAFAFGAPPRYANFLQNPNLQ